VTAAAFRAVGRLGSGFGKAKAGGFVFSQETRGVDDAMNGSRRKGDGAVA